MRKNLSKASSAGAILPKPNRLWEEEIMPYVVQVWMRSDSLTPAGVSQVKSSHQQALIFFFRMRNARKFWRALAFSKINQESNKQEFNETKISEFWFKQFCFCLTDEWSQCLTLWTELSVFSLVFFGEAIMMRRTSCLKIMKGSSISGLRSLRS